MKALTAFICLTLTVLLFTATAGHTADYEKGAAAFHEGDYATALTEWTPLAEQGDARAQFLLGAMYNEGKGVPQDYKAAAGWYTLSAEQGMPIAQYNLGQMYQQGWGVSKNSEIAAKWFMHAAEQGVASAQAALGGLYFLGKGVQMHYVYAYMWLSIAAANGMENAGEYRDTVMRQMNPEQIAEAQEATLECVRKGFKGC